jgi:transposase
VTRRVKADAGKTGVLFTQRARTVHNGVVRSSRELANCQDAGRGGTRDQPQSSASRRSVLYALRNRIERFFNKLKNARRVASRYDKRADSFLAAVQLASIKIWLRFVNRT